MAWPGLKEALGSVTEELSRGRSRNVSGCATVVGNAVETVSEVESFGVGAQTTRRQLWNHRDTLSLVNKRTAAVSFGS